MLQFVGLFSPPELGPRWARPSGKKTEEPISGSGPSQSFSVFVMDTVPPLPQGKVDTDEKRRSRLLRSPPRAENSQESDARKDVTVTYVH